MNLSLPLTLNEGVYLLPVAELPDEVRRRLDPADGDYALTRPQGRNGSKQVDRDAADLVERFREPRTLVEAVVLYSRAREAEPETVLEEAFPLIRGLVSSGYLVPWVDGAPVPEAGNALAARWQPGDPLLGGRVELVLQVLEDTEIYLLRRDGGRDGVFSVVKAARRHAGGARAFNAAALAAEGALLARLGGRPAPQLLASGEIDGQPWIEMEHIAGRDLEAEMARLGDDGAARLRLAVAVAEAYAELHAHGVVHGDVHPRNLLAERDGAVRVIDLGLARRVDGESTGDEGQALRGGVPFFYDPQLARAYLDGTPPPPADFAAEQYSIAALCYLLLAGAHRRDFSLGREQMLGEIVERPPLPFADRGAEPWPEVEAVLARALAAEPAERYPSVADFADALAAAGKPASVVAPAEGRRRTGELVEHSLAAAGPGGDWSRDELPAPSASVNYGAAGVALGLLSIAQARDDASAFAAVDPWLERARRAGGDEHGYYNPEIEIDRKTVGESSPYHSGSGIEVVAALLARARGDRAGQAAATAAFLAACERPAQGLDLTLGRASHLLAATILLDAAPPGLDGETELRSLGAAAMEEIWHRLDGEPAIVDSALDYPGIAHGWAGFLYATLAWCAASGEGVPAGVERRLEELAALARPDGRGLAWPWTLSGDGRRATMPGWCNGSCGYVFLWTYADRWTGDPRYLDLSVGAAWDAWDAADPETSLCCGLAGRGYALVNLWRHTGERVWLDRARALAERGARHVRSQPDREHCLYKGDLGLAVLAADLERPEAARMPLFEPAGWRRGAF